MTSTVKYSLRHDDSGIDNIRGWSLYSYKGPISGAHAIEDFEKTHGMKCPEMVHLHNHLTIEHPESGLCLRFATPEALKLCLFEKRSGDFESKKTTSESASASSSDNKPAAAAPADGAAKADGAADGKASSAAAAAPASVATKAVHAASSAAVKKGAVRVVMAKHWDDKKSAEAKELEMPFDWTYTSDYKGSVSSLVPSAVSLAASFSTLSLSGSGGTSAGAGGSQAASTFSLPVATDQNIPLELLKRQDPIRWYDSIVLYEDELHDNGVSSMTVKVRVMDHSFLVLLRFWLRVDGVLLRVYETRLFHEFGQPYLLREFTAREESFDELKQRHMPTSPADYKDPNVFGARIKLRHTSKERIDLGSVGKSTAAPAASSDAKPAAATASAATTSGASAPATGGAGSTATGAAAAS